MTCAQPKNLLFGISEQLVLYDHEEPLAFIPVVPLFVLKGTGVERNNNGNISGDVTYCLEGIAEIYSEFFIDDLQSPTSLFDDFWANEWAWMFGARIAREFAVGQAGIVLEYSRVEPWVYTHYRAGTVQTANRGIPLGNPLGPNSQWMIMKPYFWGLGGWYGSTQMELVWKSNDPGSSVNDTG